MLTHHYSSTGARPLDKIKGLKIIDIGGATSFADGFLDAIVDIQQPAARATHNFIGDLNDPQTWEPVLKRVATHGKWDYAICTHTLEDIINPLFVARQIEKIANAGLIIEPSKYRELARFSGKHRGFLHHHWIFDILDGILTAWPKSVFIEDEMFDGMYSKLQDNEELIIEWTGNIDMQVINQGMPFRDDEHIREWYKKLLL